MYIKSIANCDLKKSIYKIQSQQYQTCKLYSSVQTVVINSKGLLSFDVNVINFKFTALFVIIMQD